ncbi:ribosome biogenesis GTPase YlqF [Candidatus Phytoplasma sacchari]|uniref:Ribosome biogenesis GTPase A n=1 Tax=Candidatus Phytoplasma sacchari TaxID=2609813 RepID=A0ABY7M1L7_9MOLU|nr:ribosome biogenesis GTPase YlqF [Candidatus Phytoplasma sacchari]KAB8122743.1 ribosome biogenesis GTPase YlqF [Candidatus Phytoplasma sacchari]WBL31601.1 ribosome biogenesis GTPase YlqF [Candidatus Phytoplasma sacchari]
MFLLQWFPGHMKKTLQKIKLNLKLVDIILIILDARIPISSMNFELLKIINNKPFLILLNKMSLADSDKNNLFVNFFNKKKIEILFIDSKNKINIDKIFVKIKKIFDTKNKLKHYYIKNTIKLMIIGLPNVGKSTLVNCLAKKKVAITAKKPGITKKLQWISASNNIQLLDTPGILYPKINNYKIGYSLGICGCIKENLIPKEELVNYFLNYLKNYYPEKLKLFFNFDEKEIKEEINLLKTLIQKRYNEKILNQNNYDSFINHNNIIEKIFSEFTSKKIQKINFDLNLLF